MKFKVLSQEKNGNTTVIKVQVLEASLGFMKGVTERFIEAGKRYYERRKRVPIKISPMKSDVFPVY